jgi:hypothetical protein
METGFFSYLRLLELLAFFSGYPLIYAIAVVWTGWHPVRNTIRSAVFNVLPFSYALVGTLYVGLQARYIYLYLTTGSGKFFFVNPYLTFWGLLAVLFWIPPIAKRNWLCLLHSLTILFLLVKDIVTKISTPGNQPFLRNEMNIYTLSILLNLAALVLLVIFYRAFSRKSN